MKQITFLFFLIILFTSCRNESTHLKTVFGRTLNLPVSDNSNRPWGVQYRTKDTQKILTVYFKGRYLVNYDFETGNIIDSVTLPFAGKRNLYGFRYISSDSILLLHSEPFGQPRTSDSCMILINSKSKILHVYPMANLPVLSSQNQNDDIKEIAAINLIFEPLNADSKNVYFHYTNGIPEFHQKLKQKDFEAGGHVNLQSEKYTPHPVKMPFSGADTYFPTDFHDSFYAQNAESELVYGFRYFDTVYVYNPNSKNVRKERLQFELFPKVYDFSKNKPENFDLFSQYLQIYYDSYRHRYIRFAYLRGDKSELPAFKNKGTSVFVAYDDNFQKIGEGLFPSGLATVYPFFTEEGAWFIDLEKLAENSDQLCYRLCNFELEKGGVKYELEKVRADLVAPKDTGAMAYFKQLGFSKPNSFVILVPVMTSCKSCADYAVSYVLSNTDFCSKNNIHLIVAGKDKARRKQFLHTNNLDSLPECVKIDSTEQNLNYFEAFYNPTLYIIENNAVKFQRNYLPDDIFLLQEDINKFLLKK